ncbi:conserved hypothetical protein [Streptomyces sviceus ATCC 29083]|uniref:Integral membrane protein n=1 Tax=Streptomyces sviceus (strain ATCC 29083 / DSM 924 / JCM 4929 / NBRC 13980 / NCIMB 11184 / NRRL 5439 / UC 5370) TaxID=463191 RepID=B5HP91_STRX2|nr:conserved hypothetical protein [Streptomyces sviceus ATCC 29083]
MGASMISLSCWLGAPINSGCGRGVCPPRNGQTYSRFIFPVRAHPGGEGISQRGGNVGIIAWILIGLLAGAIAKLLLPGKDPGGIIITMLIGIVGGLLGGWLGKVIFGVDSIDGFFDLSTWIAAIVGSLILLVLYRVVTGNRRSHRHA